MAQIVAFDFETTGLSPRKNHVLEIGAVKFDVGGAVHGTFEQLCNPGYAIPPEITSLTGITDADITGAPASFEAIRAFLDWAGKDVIFAAHNAGFDSRFLTAAFLNAQEFAPALPIVDTLRWARSLNLPTPDCKLGTLLNFYGHNIDGLHRSLRDAHGVRALIVGWLERVAEPKAEVVARVERPKKPASATSFPEF
jgi:DNA polymerase III alpha subunit (gram-positive type)